MSITSPPSNYLVLTVYFSSWIQAVLSPSFQPSRAPKSMRSQSITIFLFLVRNLLGSAERFGHCASPGCLKLSAVIILILPRCPSTDLYWPLLMSYSLCCKKQWFSPLKKKKSHRIPSFKLIEDWTLWDQNSAEDCCLRSSWKWKSVVTEHP